MENKPSKETLADWSKDPNNWKWGFFYYNKADKRLLPPKSNPALGFTVNFANKWSVLLFVALLLIPLFIVMLISLW